MNLFVNTYRQFVFVVVCGIVLPRMAASAEDATLPRLPIESGSLLDVSGGLLAVIFAILILGTVYAKIQGVGRGSKGVINVIATQAIGPKEKIAIVEVAEKQLLIGMTTTNVQTLHVFDEPVATAAAPKVSFSERLKVAMRGVVK